MLYSVMREYVFADFTTRVGVQQGDATTECGRQDVATVWRELRVPIVRAADVALISPDLLQLGEPSAKPGLLRRTEAGGTGFLGSVVRFALERGGGGAVFAAAVVLAFFSVGVFGTDACPFTARYPFAVFSVMSCSARAAAEVLDASVVVRACPVVPRRPKATVTLRPSTATCQNCLLSPADLTIAVDRQGQELCWVIRASDACSPPLHSKTPRRDRR
jgi:hypothetical protein